MTVILALSGGVESSALCYLLKKAGIDQVALTVDILPSTKLETETEWFNDDHLALEMATVKKHAKAVVKWVKNNGDGTGTIEHIITSQVNRRETPTGPPRSRFALLAQEVGKLMGKRSALRVSVHGDCRDDYTNGRFGPTLEDTIGDGVKEKTVLNSGVRWSCSSLLKTDSKLIYDDYMFGPMITHSKANDWHYDSPFALKTKKQIVTLIPKALFDLTFSCVTPTSDLGHCGTCVKCSERMTATPNS